MATRNWLTHDSLNQEYRSWPTYGRNHQDLRFGQYLFNKYDGIPEGVFHIEGKSEAYGVLSRHIDEVQR